MNTYSLVSPVSAAVVSTFKRVVVIVAAIVWFRTPITLLHAFGIGLATLGVALYDEKHRDALSGTPCVPGMALSPSYSLVTNPRKGSGHRAVGLSSAASLWMTPGRKAGSLFGASATPDRSCRTV